MGKIGEEDIQEMVPEKPTHFHDKEGFEHCSKEKLAEPVKLTAAVSEAEYMRDLIKRILHEGALEKDDLETIEEANDFDIGDDDDIMPISRYEMEEDYDHAETDGTGTVDLADDGGRQEEEASAVQEPHSNGEEGRGDADAGDRAVGKEDRGDGKVEPK